MIKTPIARPLISIILCLLLTGCGYHFSGHGKIPGDTQSVFVSILSNRTGETGLEDTITKDLIFEFGRNLTVVSNAKQADAVLTGSIDSIEISTTAYRGQITSVERRITARVSLKLTDPSGNVLWSGRSISEEETYGVLSEKVATDYNKQQALREVSKRLARKVYIRMSERF